VSVLKNPANAVFDLGGEAVTSTFPVGVDSPIVRTGQVTVTNDLSSTREVIDVVSSRDGSPLKVIGSSVITSDCGNEDCLRTSHLSSSSRFNS